MSDCVIIGGGVIGLSIAYELARQGQSVAVLDRGPPGHEASWAGAGILPPARFHPSDEPYQQLFGLSNQLHPPWSEALRAETGINNGYRACGGYYLACDDEARRELTAAAAHWRRQEIEVRSFSPSELASADPALHAGVAGPFGCELLPEEAQIRNPRHLKALLAACRRHDVQIHANAEVTDIGCHRGRIGCVLTTTGEFEADNFCFATGAWSPLLVAKLGVTIPVKPIRGQMLLLNDRKQSVQKIINVGSRYLVPRGDGNLLVGSTEENVGFDRSNTQQAIGELLEFAIELVPSLRDATFVRSWAGLRPASADGLPYLGRVPKFENAFMAAGHFRNGLQLSTATAVVMSQLMHGEATQIDLHPFRLDRPIAEFQTHRQ